MALLMKKGLTIYVAIAALCCASCAGVMGNGLAICGGEPVVYQCGEGLLIVAKYYTLSDGSLHFVKVVMPDGREFTLPNAVSASGARYTDNREMVWWTKGDTAFVETRDLNGEWRILYRDCKVVRDGK